MNKKISFSLYLVVFCGILVITNNEVHSYNLTDERTLTNYITHDPIEILNNAAFISYGFEGEGTSEDPYIIENYRIEVVGYMSTGIFVSSTTSHFIIRNCYIVAEYLGIRIDQTAIGTVKILNNTCVSSSNEGGGIGIGWLSGCIVKNNTLINFSQGIHLNLAHSCLIQDNVVKDNNYQGINIRYSNNNIIRDNLIMNNTQHGIALVGTSNGNTIFNNTFIDNAQVVSYTIDGERSGTILSQAYDEGSSNTWYDSDTQVGNLWSDYTGEGDYAIDGPSESFDIYPTNLTQTSRTNFNLVFVGLMLLVIISLKVIPSTSSSWENKI